VLSTHPLALSILNHACQVMHQPACCNVGLGTAPVVAPEPPLPRCIALHGCTLDAEQAQGELLQRALFIARRAGICGSGEVATACVCQEHGLACSVLSVLLLLLPPPSKKAK
jgi:hypothetical protein